jgi:hypothetical protein
MTPEGASLLTSLVARLGIVAFRFRGEPVSIGHVYVGRDGEVMVEINLAPGQGITHTGGNGGYTYLRCLTLSS